MNNPIVHSLYYMFAQRGFSVLRFNFRGVGRSQGLFENGAGELSDAASALDWLQAHNREAKICWIAGISFGAWISMQLLMRRPEISGFISVAPLAKHYDFSFLAPCPASGLFVNGEKDTVTAPEAVNTLVTKLKTQKGIVIEHKVIPGAQPLLPGQDRRANQGLCRLSRQAAVTEKLSASPLIGSLTFVVIGKLSGNLLRLRTATRARLPLPPSHH